MAANQQTQGEIKMVIEFKWGRQGQVKIQIPVSLIALVAAVNTLHAMLATLGMIH